jgi:hypothetical protein
MMRLALHITALTACLSAALPVAAGCVTSDTLAKGVAFTRADGVGGLAIQDGTKVWIEYRFSAPKGNRDERVGRFGIYETETISEGIRRNGTVIEGRARHETSIRFARPGSEPVPGETFKSTFRAKTRSCIASECVEIWRTWGSATYRFMQSETVRISDCAYKVIPVEATFFGTVPIYTQRWLYFPDLGFGLETRVTDHLNGTNVKLGLTSIMAVP